MRLNGAGVICCLSAILSVFVILHACFLVKPIQGSAIVGSFLFSLVIYILARSANTFMSPILKESCGKGRCHILRLMWRGCKETVCVCFSLFVLGLLSLYLFPEVVVALNRLFLSFR